MSGKMHPILASGVAAAAVLLSLTSAVAQQPQPQPLPSAQGRPPARAPAATARPVDKETKAEPSQARSGDAQLRQRIEQLEEQLVDMQVVIGTLESLARAPAQAGSAAPPARGFSSNDGADQGRIDSLETQIRALTSQLEQLSDQVRQLGGRRTDAGGSGGLASRESPGPAPRSDTGGFRQSGPAAGAEGSFGSVTVTPGPDRDPIGRMITTDQDRSDQPSSQQSSMSTGGSAKELYETAYGYLLQQDYGAAEVAFEEFLQRHPTDRLAADAQYWLGETLYVQRRYKPAAQAFLKVMQNHQSSAKVPNSLLKLAMTLEQLGQKDCALFSELDSRHPNAAADVKSRAKLVRQRVGC